MGAMRFFGLSFAALSFALLLTTPGMAQEEAVPAPEDEFAFDEAFDFENLVALMGEVTAIAPEAGTISVQEVAAEGEEPRVTTLRIDPNTSTIWGEYDEISLSDLPVGSKVAGEYVLNDDGSKTVTYLEIVLDDEALLPPLEDFDAFEEEPAPEATE